MPELQLFLKAFGLALKKARKGMSLSQVAAAQQMGIDYRHYQNIEGGKVNLRLDTLFKLIRFYRLQEPAQPITLDSCISLFQEKKSESPVQLPAGPNQTHFMPAV